MCCRFSRKLLGLVTVLGLTLPSTAQSQVSRQLELRGGSGISTTGKLSFTAQIGLNENEGRNSVELALVGYGTSYSKTTSSDTNIGIRSTTEYTTARTDIIGGTIAANLLLRHGMEVSGPYFVVGAGVGLFMVDWARTNWTDSTVNSSWLEASCRHASGDQENHPTGPESLKTKLRASQPDQCSI